MTHWVNSATQCWHWRAGAWQNYELSRIIASELYWVNASLIDLSSVCRRQRSLTPQCSPGKLLPCLWRWSPLEPKVLWPMWPSRWNVARLTRTWLRWAKQAQVTNMNKKHICGCVFAYFWHTEFLTYFCVLLKRMNSSPFTLSVVYLN